ncbi:Uncharacterised protein [Vibrio cholerae]|nr:Uncharacterised protein [Vibrio cholerae]CSI52845.1 Uncharacterised protein [Vibrio cholerae]
MTRLNKLFCTTIFLITINHSLIFAVGRWSALKR